MTLEPDGTARPFHTQFYGRRLSRPLRPNRRAALLERLPARSIELADDGALIEPATLFPRAKSEVWLEIGFGAGEHLIKRAQARPDVGFIGCEPYVNGVAALVSRAEAMALGHIRVFADDARLLLDRLRPATIARVFILFPDPWPKKRHHRRRLIQPDIVRHLARILIDGGVLLFATDNMDYARWALNCVTANSDFSWLARRPADWREQPQGWETTRYEAKAQARGERCVYLSFLRRATVPAVPLR
ncbi:MAG: tRNA (guanosine(46)-N7)-methyltransferase TrmB [Rhodospirillales bacterium]|nr:tRNA (guanosine(46)-N7)-methyltransferase TrmB [Rhodospirillales bacterium]